MEGTAPSPYTAARIASSFVSPPGKIDAALFSSHRNRVLSWLSRASPRTVRVALPTTQTAMTDAIINAARNSTLVRPRANAITTFVSATPTRMRMAPAFSRNRALLVSPSGSKPWRSSSARYSAHAASASKLSATDVGGLLFPKAF